MSGGKIVFDLRESGWEGGRTKRRIVNLFLILLKSSGAPGGLTAGK